MPETWVWSLGQEDPLEKEMATHPSILAWKIPWTEKPGRLQSMGSQSQTGLSDFTFKAAWEQELLISSKKSHYCLLSFILEWYKHWVYKKAMATHAGTLAWNIPWTEEPGRLQSMGSRRVGLDWATSLTLFTFMPWKRKWQPIPEFLPGESQGQQSLVGCRL